MGLDAQAVEIRVRMLEILAYLGGRGEASPSEVARQLGITRQGAHKALEGLRGRGFVCRRVVGRGCRYRLTNCNQELHWETKMRPGVARVWLQIECGPAVRDVEESA